MNTVSSSFNDKCLEMGIVRQLKAVNFNSFQQYPNATAWLKPYSLVYDKLAELVGDKVRGSHTRRYDDFAEVDWLQEGYDRTKAHAFKVHRMFQRIKTTGHLGRDFINAEHICNFPTGQMTEMDDSVAE